jgi:glycosyltransferase involved in cell wall biosynthesis
VGRIGKEKNLALLAAAFKQLHTFNSEVHLFVIGDGPYRIELEEMLADLPVTFTGFIEGDELPRAIASCDVKLFPSTTDTWGNAPLEAQASGLPVIVSDVGGPQELMLPGVTGFKICGHSTQAMVDAMTTLLNPLTREHMGQAARLFSEDNVVDLPFSAVLESESYRKRVAESEALAKSGRGQNAVTMQVFDLASETFENMVGGEAAATMP